MQAYPRLWEDHGNVVDVPETNWVPIPLVDDWQSKYTCKAKVYPRGKMDKEVVGKEFDKLQEQGRLEWSNQPTILEIPLIPSSNSSSSLMTTAREQQR